MSSRTGLHPRGGLAHQPRFAQSAGALTKPVRGSDRLAARPLDAPDAPPAPPRRLAVLSVHLALGLFLLAAGWLALGAATGGYLLNFGAVPDWLHGPLGAIGAEFGVLGPVQFNWALVVMFGTYLALVAGAHRIPSVAVWVTVGVATSLFMLAPTIVSTDVFGYISYARLGVLYGLNPYLRAPIAAPHDAVLPLVYWRHATSPYGPLFTLFSYPLALLGPITAYWVLKASAAGASIALAVVTSRAAARRGLHPLRAAILVGLNPVLLLYAVAGAHNDLGAALLVVAAILFALGDRERRGAALLVAAAAVKVTLGLALPYLIVGARRPRLALYAALGTGVVVLGVATALFGPHLIGQLQRVATDPMFDIRFSGPDLLGSLLGTGITALVRGLVVGAAAALALLALERTRRGGDWIAAAGWATLALLASIASFAPWYLVWLLPLAALTRGWALRATALALTAYVLAVHLPLLGGMPWLSSR